MKGSFEGKELSAFTGPLQSLAKLVEDGIVLNVSQANKTLSVFALNAKDGVMAHVTYNTDLFKNFEMLSDEKVGILNVQQWVKYFQILDGDKLDIAFENNVFSLANTAGAVSFKTADPDMIKESPKNFKGSAWYSNVNVDIKFKTLLKAMSVLDTEDCVFIKGDKNTNKVQFTVRATGLEINSFKMTIDTPVSEDFETFYKKDMFEKALNTPSETTTISLGEKIARFECKSKLCDITYYVAKKQSK